MTSICIIDYGMGNIQSIGHALDELGISYRVSSDSREIQSAQGLILPGVGAFGEAMQNIDERGLAPVLNEEVAERKKPVLGICLGMQLMCTSSTENGLFRGLNWIHATIDKLRVEDGLPLPHVGWNDSSCDQAWPLFDRVSENASFYFDHMYCISRIQEECTLAHTSYGVKFVSALQRDNIVATQFHPEKSQRNGLKLLRNFGRMVEEYDA